MITQKIRRIGCGLSGYDYNRAWAYWKDLEPIEGRYNFKPIYDVINQGKPVLIRVMMNLPGSGIDGCPTWLPIQRYGYTHGTKGAAFEYDYNDPLFIPAVTRLYKALGARFNGHPMVMAVEVGILGQWGEWTTYAYNPTQLLYSVNTQRSVIKACVEAFTMTPVLGRCLENSGNPTAVSVGWEFDIGVHDDVFGHVNMYNVEAALTKYNKVDLYKSHILGGEVYPPYCQDMITTRFSEFCDMIRSRKPSYLTFIYTPQNQQELDNLMAARNIIKYETGY